MIKLVTKSLSIRLGVKTQNWLGCQPHGKFFHLGAELDLFADLPRRYFLFSYLEAGVMIAGNKISMKIGEQVCAMIVMFFAVKKRHTVHHTCDGAIPWKR